ncbi:MAG: HD domain-containing protein [Candidatus Dormiibacterota bacterium]
MASMPTRADALELLYQTTKTDSLRRHGLAVEAVMRQAARRAGGDEEEWAITGLLHDFDYEAHPKEHPFWGRPVLESQGYPKEVVLAIQGHANFSGVPRDTEMARWLFALDELTGFVMAVAMVQPERMVSTVKTSSVRKKLKDKSFARSVLREDIALGSEELGIEVEQLVELVVAGLSPIATELGLGSAQ